MFTVYCALYKRLLITIFKMTSLSCIGYYHFVMVNIEWTWMTIPVMISMHYTGMRTDCANYVEL